jgi:hypothetical protein
MNITLKDEFGFLEIATNNHTPLLLWALELTKEGNVLELGCGYGSTPYLQNYCKANNRALYSYDSNKEWVDKFEGAIFINDDWEKSGYYDRNYSVALIDEAPAEHRPISVKNLIGKVDIFIAHDTEPENEKYYHMISLWPLFKYVLHDNHNRIWTTIFSNKYDITKLKTINGIKLRHGA